MKLFTKEIDKKLFEQYPKGGSLENQMVVAKIFNPYGRGTWYIINSDPEDPDYLWAIVDLFEVEVGGVNRSDLENAKVKPFMLGFERDTSFKPVNASELYRGLLDGKRYADGGSIGAENKDMVMNNNVQIMHHAKELSEAVKNAKQIPAWVVAKVYDATQTLSDVTHYLDGENKMAKGGNVIDKYRDELEAMDDLELANVVYDKLGFSREETLEQIQQNEAYRDDLIDSILDSYSSSLRSRGEKFAEGGGVKISRSQKKYNKEVDAYKWFIVNTETKNVVSGWEYKQDAIDALSDYDGDKNYKVIAEVSLKKLGIENPKEKFKKLAKGGGIKGEVEVGTILYATTGVPVEVLQYDSKFGGRVLIKRADGINTDAKPSWKPLSKFTKKMQNGGDVSATEIAKMKKINVKGFEAYMPSVSIVYYDTANNKYYFKDYEGDFMELRNENTLQNLRLFLNKKTTPKMAEGGNLPYTYSLIRKWSDNMVTDADIDSVIQAMIKAKITDTDLVTPPTKTGTQFTKAKEKLNNEIFKKIQEVYVGNLKGNQPYGIISTMVDRATRFDDKTIAEYKKQNTPTKSGWKHKKTTKA